MGECKGISVVLPVYNVVGFIEEALDSLLQQTVLPHEIIVINDGSTDGTLELLQSRYAGCDLLKIHSQSNQGVGAARRKGLSLAQGDFVYFCDPDDVVRTDMFEGFQRQLLIDEGLELYYFSMRAFVDEGGGRTFLRRNTASVRPGWLESGKCLLQDLVVSQQHSASTCQFIFKRSVCQKFPVRFVGRVHEDHWFSMNIYLYSGKTFSLSDSLYYQRVRPGSLTRCTKDQAYVMAANEAYRDTLSALKLHVDTFYKGREVALSYMEQNVKTILMLCVKNDVPVPGRFFSLTRRDVKACGVKLHNRAVLLLPELFYHYQKLKHRVRLFKRGLRKS